MTSYPSLIEYVRYIFNMGMALAGILAMLAILFGAINYLISFSRGKYTDEGKSWIKSGITGLLILTSAYLIAYTINPNLVTLKLEKLFPINLNSVFPILNDSTDSLEGNYQEIPLGIMTENLLARATDCYDFDGNGDPIEGEQIKTDDGRDINGPTYLERDRVDCFIKLGQAVEKKSLAIKKLSDEITKLMEMCSCAGTFAISGLSSGNNSCKNPYCAKPNIADPKGETSDCKYVNSSCPIDKKCIGSTKPCQDTCSNKGCAGSGNCCPTDAKNKMEHGPINMPDCNGSGKNYTGLDEFRSQFNNNYGQIKNTVEIQPVPKINGREITIIEKNRWKGLRLVDQLIYLKGKIEDTKSNVNSDIENLTKGRDLLAQCSERDMERSSVDILHIQEKTKKEDKKISIAKKFNDPKTQQPINVSKYCNGFNYANSDCFQQCQNMCPDTSKDAISCYASVKKCDPNDSENNYIACLKTQEKQIEDCFNAKPCVFGNSKNFQQCITSCQSQCSENCSKTFCSNPVDLKNCQDSCNNNSKCVLENKDKCLFNSQFFQYCGNAYKDLNCAVGDSGGDCGNLKNCINNSYLCQYGSDQNSGYPDCLKSYRDCEINPQNFGLQHKSQCLSYISSEKQYSASFLYKNPADQLCANPYRVFAINDNLDKTTCLALYPNTEKCPASSNCPLCPCDTVDKTINYLPAPVPLQPPTDACPIGSSSPSNTCQSTDPSKPGYCSGAVGACVGGICKPLGSATPTADSSKKIEEYRVVAGQCSSYTYNSDPLTFYCRTAWEPQAPVSGRWYQTKNPEVNEIPVGQTVDDSLKWGQTFLDETDKLTKKITKLIDYIKNIADKKNYCQCASKCETVDSNNQQKSACQAKCAYSQTEATTKTETYPDGSTTTVNVPAKCSCVRQACSGNPCQLMIDLLKGPGTSADGNCANNAIGFESFYVDISNGVKDFFVFIVSETRSDILKKLSYSRKKMDECSQQSTGLGGDLVTAFSCTKAYRHTTYLTKRCYGIYDGQVKNATQTDNWFCVKTSLR